MLVVTKMSENKQKQIRNEHFAKSFEEVVLQMVFQWVNFVLDYDSRIHASRKAPAEDMATWKKLLSISSYTKKSVICSNQFAYWWGERKKIV